MSEAEVVEYLGISMTVYYHEITCSVIPRK